MSLADFDDEAARAAIARGPDLEFERAMLLEAVGEALRAAVEEMQAAQARMMAELRAAWEASARQLAEAGRLLLEDKKPGTFLGDYLRVVDQEAPDAERAAALRRLAGTLGVVFRVKGEWRGLRKQALRALRLLVQRDEEWPAEILDRDVLAATWLATVDDFRQPQTRREGKRWVKDGRGKKLLFVPAQYYRLGRPDMLRAQAHLRDLARDRLEIDLMQRAGLREPEVDSRDWGEVELALLASGNRPVGDSSRDQPTSLLPTITPEDLLIGPDFMRALKAELSSEVLDALELRLRGFEPDEIAATLGKSRDAVYKLLARAAARAGKLL